MAFCKNHVVTLAMLMFHICTSYPAKCTEAEITSSGYGDHSDYVGFLAHLKPVMKHEDVASLGIKESLANKADAKVKLVPITDIGKGDDRKYQGAVLANGLQVLNIEDSSSLTSAMAMGVLSGSYNNPKDVQGLAHFCEHMLFLGSKQFPDPSGYEAFLSKHGGGSNAFTASELTDYYFQVGSSAVDEILPRFADQFRSPLFNRTYVGKEVHAIASEHAKNKQDPNARWSAVIEHMANPKSPVSWFATGNIKTLLDEPKKKGIDTVDALKKYFNEHYCPPKMRLVTFGPTSLSEQFAAAEKAFGNLTTTNEECKKPISWATPEPWPKDRLGKWVTILGTQEQASLVLMFPTPATMADYASRPDMYLNYLFNYNGLGSFSTVLSDTLGLVSGFSVGHSSDSSGGKMMMAMDLTDKGQAHRDVVLDLLFAYVAAVRRAGVNKELYSSLKDLSKLQFDWAGKSAPSATVESFAAAMKDMHLPDVVWGGARIDVLNTSLVQSLLEKITPDNMIVSFVAPGNASKVFSSNQTVETLPNYDVKYSAQSFESVLPGKVATWAAWISGKTKAAEVTSHCNSELTKIGEKPLQKFPEPPGPIKDVPKQIPLEHMHATLTAEAKAKPISSIFGPDPQRLKSKLPKAEDIWYRSGWMTNSPQVSISVSLRALWNKNDAKPSAKENVEVQLYNMLMTKEMAPRMVDLVQTGVTYSATASSDGLSFGFSGFTPTLDVLVKQVVGAFSNFSAHGDKVTPANRWKDTKDAYADSLRTYSQMPMMYAISDRNTLLTSNSFTQKELLDAWGETTLSSVLAVGSKATKKKPLKLTVLSMGNLEQSRAERSIQAIKDGVPGIIDRLNEAEKSSDDVQRVVPIVNPAGPVELRKLNPRPGDPNDVTIVTTLYGVSDPRSRAYLSILGNILQNVAYDELRTQRQLGYVVNAGMIQLSNVLGMSVLVQGTKLKADEVEPVIYSVLHKTMPERLASLNDKDFKSYVDSFRQSMISPPAQYAAEFTKFWGPIISSPGGECFGMDDEMLSVVKDIKSKQPLVDLWKKLFEPQAGTRKKLVVKYFAHQVPKRPTLTEAKALWDKVGLSAENKKLLEKERDGVTLLQDSSSALREQLRKAGGEYPLTLNCKAIDQSTPGGGAIKSSSIRIALGSWVLFLLACAWRE